MRGPRAAVGTPSDKRWLEIGRMQFDYLTSHGLGMSDKLLEIGCGNLRAGWRFIEWLEPGNYTGVDISPDILLAATKTIEEHNLQSKTPSLMLYDGFDLSFLPSEHYDVLHAHSVFSHTPIEVIESVLTHASRMLKPGGFFDFTYNRSETGESWGFLDEDYYYPTETLTDLAEGLGMLAAPAEGWTYKQDKLRVTRPV